MSSEAWEEPGIYGFRDDRSSGGSWRSGSTEQRSWAGYHESPWDESKGKEVECNVSQVVEAEGTGMDDAVPAQPRVLSSVKEWRLTGLLIWCQ